MMETSNNYFNQRFYMTEIQKLVFYLPNLHIIGTRDSGNTHR